MATGSTKTGWTARALAHEERRPREEHDQRYREGERGNEVVERQGAVELFLARRGKDVEEKMVAHMRGENGGRPRIARNFPGRIPPP
jgi:hypothetical protein